MFLAITMFFVLSYSVYADSNTKGNLPDEKTLQDVLSEIRQSQGIDKNQPIDCRKVTDKQFEELGDAFMGVMPPDTQEHEFMDRMMGGEGSSTLSYIHRMMGARYLGCYRVDMMGGMMGYPSAFPAWKGGRGMMGNYGYGQMMDFGYGGIIMWAVFVILIVVIVYIIAQSAKSKTSKSTEGEKPLEILKKRYARGEITKDEFDKIRKDL